MGTIGLFHRRALVWLGRRLLDGWFRLMRLQVHAGILEVHGPEHPATRMPTEARPDERRLLRRSSADSGAGEEAPRPRVLARIAAPR